MIELPTPETDALDCELHNPRVLSDRYSEMINHAQKLERERDEAREALSDWENAALHVEADHPDEKHCGCVPVLRKLLTDAREKLDEEMKWHHRTHTELVHTQCKILDMQIGRDEAQKELSSIHRWIERNHADGFIDSLTYFQNLERVTDSWYDRLDRLEVDAVRLERERDEAREALASREVVIAQHSVITDLILERDKWAKLCGQYKQERDEAMSELKNNGQ
jgi:hypothetical protein